MNNVSKRIKNNPFVKTQRRELRKNQTDAERKIWSILRREQMGVRFLDNIALVHMCSIFTVPRSDWQLRLTAVSMQRKHIVCMMRCVQNIYESMIFEC